MDLQVWEEEDTSGPRPEKQTRRSPPSGKDPGRGEPSARAGASGGRGLGGFEGLAGGRSGREVGGGVLSRHRFTAGKTEAQGDEPLAQVHGAGLPTPTVP